MGLLGPVGHVLGAHSPWEEEPLQKREQHLYYHTFPVPMSHLYFILLFRSLHQPWGTNENSATGLAAQSPQVPGTGHGSWGLSFTLLCWHSTEGLGRYSWKKITSSGYPQLLRLPELWREATWSRKALEKVPEMSLEPQRCPMVKSVSAW